MRASSTIALLLIASLTAACGSGDLGATPGPDAGSSPEAGSPIHVASTDVLDVQFEPGGAQPGCPSGTGQVLASDYRIDFAAGTLHVDETLACEDDDAGVAAHSTHDIVLGKTDGATLLSLANAMVLETVTQCYVDGQTTVVTISSATAPAERYVVGEQGGSCTVGATEIRGAEFDLLMTRISSLAD